MLALLSCSKDLKIVQIGANDGANRDPIYRFVRQFPERTSILLIEPQEYLMPYLEENYGFHNNKKIFNGAIGPDGILKLYVVNKSCWDDLDVPYTKGMPQYLGPTGITSSNREHVRRWLSRYLKKQNGKVDIEAAILEMDVPSTQLSRLLREMDFGQAVDVLQVDVEGYDDQAIYHSNIDELMPKVINFEACHLPPERLEKLVSFLEERGYFVSHHGSDALAILSTPPRSDVEQGSQAAHCG